MFSLFYTTDPDGKTPPSSPRPRRIVCGASLVVLVSIALNCGCHCPYPWNKTVANDTQEIEAISARMDRPGVEIHPAAMSSSPVTVSEEIRLEELQYRDVSLFDVISMAMQNSDVLRELGGVILRNPDIVASRYNPAAWQADPRFSTEAALSEFDAQLAATAYFNRRDQTFNNPFFAGGTNTLTGQLDDYNVELSKRTATGSRLALRGVHNYDANNAPSNTYPSAWNSYVEGEIRQPLLQGGGMEFNRIAGPTATPGVYNGLLIARANMDISQIDFQMSVRDYVSNVVNAYWDLYFGYRDLDARIGAMNRALEALNRVNARAENDLDSEARVALAAEQYYRFRDEVLEALTGRIVQGTQNGNGSTGGTVRGTGGVQLAERRLRFLIGIPINENEMLRPSENPPEAEVVFQWDSAMQEALSRRPELRRQQLKLQKRQMELLAARNFINPRLDTVGRYRFRGFGDDLLAYNGKSSSLGNLADGDLQEWYLGLEYTVPLGYRKGHLAVTNAELLLSRERAILREQEREVILDLSNAVADVSRAYASCQNTLKRLDAASRILESYETQEQNGLDVDIDRMLDAQRRVVESEIRYFHSRVEYAIALKNVHLEKGSLMAYNDLDIFDGENPLVRETMEMTDNGSSSEIPLDPSLPNDEVDSATDTDLTQE